MKNIIAHRMVSRWLFLCLILTASLPIFAQCPDYPRAMDQVFVCYDPAKPALKFDQNATLHNPVRFTFPTLPSDVTVSFDYDADDLNPAVAVSSGEIKTVTYSAPGQFRLYWVIQWISGYEQDPLGNPVPIFDSKTGYYNFQTNFNNADASYGDFLPNETWSDIVGDTYTPPASNAYPAGAPNTLPVNAGGLVQILYANPDHQMRKPFIMVEGFDPITVPLNEYEVTDPSGQTLGYGGVRWDVFVTGRDESYDVDPTQPGVPHTPRFGQFPALISGLRARGYDLIYVDFADAGAYIQANAAFLTKVIERVNNVKVGVEQTVLVGASMGGIIGRHALAKMEKDGKTHCVGLFGTLDTPHNGANIPLSLQAFGWHLHATGENNTAWDAMETPAARQQLIKHLGAAVQNGEVTPENDPLGHTIPMDFSELSNADYSILRTQLKTELQELGWPKQPRKIAMSDGMKNGALNNGQGFGPGDKFCESNVYADQLNLGTVFKLIMRSNSGGGQDFYSISGLVDCSNFQENGWSDRHIFTIAAPRDFNPCIIGPWGSNDVPFKYNVWRLKVNSDLPFLDNAPGGFRMDMRSVHHSIETGLKPRTTYNRIVDFPITTFVPTWSALAMGTALNNDNLFVNLGAPEFDPLNLPNAKIPNFDNFYAPTTSLRHVEPDAGMVAFILGELDRLGAAQQPGTLTTIYNYGEGYKQIPQTTVTSTGILLINNPGPTGYIQSNPQGNATKPIFTTYLNSCGQNITVENGGQYIIGAINRSQHGVTEVWEGGSVHIKAGGTLRITSEQSLLWLKKGSTLILDGGANVVLESPGASIKIQGDLVVNGDIHFTGMGYFDFDENNRLVFGPGYDIFNLSGMGKDKRFVRLNANVQISDNHRLNWSNGLLEVRNGALTISNGAGLDFKTMTITGKDANGLTAIEATEPGAMTLENCKVEKLVLPILGRGGFGSTIIQCEFSKYTVGVTWEDAGFLTISGSIFDGSSTPASTAVQVKDVVVVTLGYSSFFGHIDPALSGVITDGKLRNCIPAVNLDNIVACMVKGTSFSNNSIGIKSDNPGTTSNVYAYQGSSFSFNGAGIYVVGLPIQGTVLADCVSFNQNRHGIRGHDVTLMIDSQNSKIFDFDTDTPNQFVRKLGPGPGTTESHVKICYDKKDASGSTKMRNNAWRFVNGPLTQNDPNAKDIVFLHHADCTGSAALPEIEQRAMGMYACALEQRPANFGTAYPGSECTVYTVGSGGNNTPPVTVHEQFHLGTYLMKADSTMAGIEALRPVAALWQPNMYGYTSNCKQYIQVARAFVDARDQATANGLRPAAERAQQSTVGNLLIAPNPAENSALLQLPENQHSIKVWDAHGQICHQATASGTYRLDTSTWQQGIYFVETVSADGTRRSGKLVVQR